MIDPTDHGFMSDTPVRRAQEDVNAVVRDLKAKLDAMPTTDIPLTTVPLTDTPVIMDGTITVAETWEPTPALCFRGTTLYQLWISNLGHRELRPVPTIEQAAPLYGLNGVPIKE